ncbi:MAG: hypothetical protein JSV53_08825 [candidate division WOR-3 bacterium]|nr:MAG: hypothetical protein JSV53_08825 [candidate division WOR-3 bacterium]
MKQKIEEILDVLLLEMEKGKSPDDLLRDYPQYADELGPLLQLARNIAEMPKPVPDAKAVQSAIRRIQKVDVHGKRFDLRDFFRLSILPVRITAVLLFLFIFEVTTVSLSARSLPGHFLYRVKRFAENVQHTLTVDSEGKARLHVVFADRRTNEFYSSVEPGVEFDDGLMCEMLQEIEYAFEHIRDLNEEGRERLIDLIHECNLFQVEVLERTKEHACACNIEKIEEALRNCMDHRECLECIRARLKYNNTEMPAGT